MTFFIRAIRIYGKVLQPVKLWFWKPEKLVFNSFRTTILALYISCYNLYFCKKNTQLFLRCAFLMCSRASLNLAIEAPSVFEITLTLNMGDKLHTESWEANKVGCQANPFLMSWRSVSIKNDQINRSKKTVTWSTKNEEYSVDWCCLMNKTITGVSLCCLSDVCRLLLLSKSLFPMQNYTANGSFLEEWLLLLLSTSADLVGNWNMCDVRCCFTMKR